MTSPFWECLECGLRYNWLETCPRCKPEFIGTRPAFSNTEQRIQYLQKTIQGLLELINKE